MRLRAVLPSINELAKHCETVPELKPHVHRVKSFARQYEDEPTSSAKVNILPSTVRAKKAR